MPYDAHAHPYNLSQVFPGEEAERRRLETACVASAWNLAEFEFHERLAREAGAPIIVSFGTHPQLPASPNGERLVRESLATLERLAGEGRLGAIGETGFDAFNRDFRDTLALQEEIFEVHLRVAEERSLPITLHIRRAMDRAFAHTRELRRIPAVIFHSYSGTLEDASSLLKRGINCYFSFGNPILLNHKTAMAAVSSVPADRLLLETDAPFQPLRGEPFSRWGDLSGILRGAAALRETPAEELQLQIDANFRKVYGLM